MITEADTRIVTWPQVRAAGTRRWRKPGHNSPAAGGLKMTSKSADAVASVL